MIIAFEDRLTEAVIDRLLGEKANKVDARIHGRGFGNLKRKIPQLNKTGKSIPVLLITDLDSEICPKTLIKKWMGGKKQNPNFIFRVAVKEIESWILADKENFAAFIDVPISRMSFDVETIVDVKSKLFSIVKHSKNREIKQAILPAKGMTAPIGAGYNDCLIGFVYSNWNIQNAAKNARSLKRAIEKLKRYID
jgi:hypothetical protein